MILCEWTPSGGSLTRISTEDIALDFQWYSYITSIASIKFQTTELFGGYAKPSFSDITLSPNLFEGSWPPAKTAAVKLVQTETTEAAGTILFDGTAHRTGFDRTGVNYELKQPEFDATIAESTAYSGTLASVVDTLCGSGILDLTVDHTEERATTPTVAYTTSKDVQAIDLLAEMCAFFTHAFKIVEGTLYLYDMLSTTTPTALTEFDILPSSYTDDEPISLITQDDDSVAGSNPNGDEVKITESYASAGTNTEAALTNIKTVLESEIAVIDAKIDADKPTILDCLTLTDESTIGDTTTSGRAMSVIYNFDSLDMQIEARGSVT